MIDGGRRAHGNAYMIDLRVCCASRCHLIWLARGRAWKDAIAPKPCPKEFRDDVVRVAENREPVVTIERIAADFGVHPMTLTKWLARSRAEKTASETGSPWPSDRDAELRELRQRNQLLEQEVEVLRRATASLSQAHLPGTRS